MMKFLMDKTLLAMDVSVSEPLLVGFLAVLVVLIVLLTVLSTIYAAGFRRKLRASLSKVTAVAEYDKALGQVTLTDASNEEKSEFNNGENVKVIVKANKGQKLLRLTVVANEGYLFTVNGKDKDIRDGVYEFVISANTKIKAEFETITVIETEQNTMELPQPETFEISTNFDSNGGRVTMTNVAGEQKTAYVADEKVRIAVFANEGYYLARLVVNGEEKQPVEGVYEIVITGPVTVDAKFELIRVPVTYTVNVEANDMGEITITDQSGEKLTKFIESTIVKVNVKANDGCVLAQFTVNDEEKELKDGAYEFIINADTTVKAQFEAIPQPEPQPEPQPDQEVAVAEVDEDDEDEVMFDGHNVIRFNKSFTAKVIQLDDVSNGWYTELKNELLSYKKVKDRMSWKRESYRLGKVCVARFVIRGKTLCIQLPLDPTKYEETKYKVEDISHIVSSADTPCLYRIKNERRLNYAKDLIAEVMENMGTEQIEREYVDYYQPYDTTLNLIERQLVKKIVKFNGKTGYGGIVEKLTEDPTKAKETEESTDNK